MMKHLFWYPWVMAALALGILICLALMIRMLLPQPDAAALYTGAQFVWGGMMHAAA